MILTSLVFPDTTQTHPSPALFKIAYYAATCALTDGLVKLLQNFSKIFFSETLETFEFFFFFFFFQPCDAKYFSSDTCSNHFRRFDFRKNASEVDQVRETATTAVSGSWNW